MVETVIIRELQMERIAKAKRLTSIVVAQSTMTAAQVFFSTGWESRRGSRTIGLARTAKRAEAIQASSVDLISSRIHGVPALHKG